MGDDERALATKGLAAAWVVVFLAMQAWERTWPTAWGLAAGSIPTTTSALFGDLTTHEVLAGQVWRTVTATFIHFSVLHLALNLVGLWQLGAWLESSYGPGLMLLVYVVIGGLGNLASALIRPRFGYPPDVHSGGGSTVIAGYITLIAVIGWRSRTRYGAYVNRAMVVLLVLNGALGVALREYVDNFGHLCGAVVGAAIGLANRPIERLARRGASRWAIPLGLGLLAACGGWQARWAVRAAHRADERLDRVRAAEERFRVAAERVRRGQEVRALLQVADLAYHLVARPRSGPAAARSVRFLWLEPRRSPLEEAVRSAWRAELARDLARLRGARAGSGPADLARHYRGWRTLAARALAKTPSPRELAGFEAASLDFAARLGAEQEQAVRARDQAQRDLLDLARRLGLTVTREAPRR